MPALYRTPSSRVRATVVRRELDARWAVRHTALMRVAVLLLSEDLDEILELSDRIVVMRQGAIVYETAGAGADAHVIGGHMVGRG